MADLSIVRERRGLSPYPKTNAPRDHEYDRRRKLLFDPRPSLFAVNRRTLKESPLAMALLQNVVVVARPPDD